MRISDWSSDVCSSDPRSFAHVEAFKARARAGMLMINQPTAGVDYHAPFGGRGASSHGAREQGRAAREFYTTKVTSNQLPIERCRRNGASRTGLPADGEIGRAHG